MDDIKAVFLKPLHPAMFRYFANHYPIVLGVVNYKPSENLDFRICYKVAYADGIIDYVPMSEAGYAFELTTEQKS